MKLLHNLYEKLQNNRKKEYAIYKNKTIKYDELAKKTRKISDYYIEKRIKNKQKIIIYTNNEEAITFFSISALLNGITIIIVPYDTKPLRASSLITKSNPSLIIVDEEKLESLPISSEYKIFPLIKSSTGSNSLLAKFNRLKKPNDWFTYINENFNEIEPTLTASDDDIAFIFFTSGSTNSPKGVQISYCNLFTHLDTLGKQFSYSSNSKILNNMMLPHADGMLQGPILALYYSATLYRPCNMDLQNMESYLNSIYREQITHVITVPTILSFIDKFTQHNDYFDSSEFKVLASVAGMLNIDLWQRLEERFNIRISNIYGLTETVAGGVFCGPDDQTYKRGTVGKPIDMKAKIVDEYHQEVLTHQEGELLLKGDNVFLGYYDDELASLDAMKDGWLKTGDIACYDNEGFIHIKGRIKELIVSGGFNIHPAEVNEVLAKHEAVADVGTLGLADDDWQEIVVSAVVIKEDKNISESELINYCRQQIEPRKVPKKIIFVSQIPRGLSGKIKATELKKIFEKEKQSIESSLDFTLKDLFFLVAKELTVDEQQLSLTDKAGELSGWDSLGHLNLMLAVEQATNINLTAHEIMSISSLQDIWSIIQSKQG
jgi:long-chain acyl-CoA synthetase